ncbi:MAG: hypothetical protein PSX81_04045 [bacterium]|nr:hypothetical protein [bacterium]
MTPQQATKTMLVLLGLVILFHLLIITQMIPYTIVWAGKLKNEKDMYQFEGVSLFINLLLILLLLIKVNYLKLPLSPRFITIMLWLFVFLFALNTIGNLFAKTNFEKFVFTPLTFISSLLLIRIVKK